MRYATIILVLLMTACGSPAERAIEKALYEGAGSYRKDEFKAAADAYAPAAFDPSVSYDLGNALYRQAQWDTAVIAFAQASDALPKETLKAAAYHNLGNGWTRRAEHADSLSQRMADKARGFRIEGSDVGTKVRRIVQRDSMQRAVVQLEHLVDSALTQGSSAYRNALRISPKDEDTRHNLALVQARMAARAKEAADRNANDPNKDKELSERAKAILAKADELVEQYKFQEALKVLQDGLKADPTLKEKQDYMNKLDVVTKAAEAS